MDESLQPTQNFCRNSEFLSFFFRSTGCFFNWASPENVSRLAPPHKSLDWPPSKSSKYENHSALRLFLIIRGGQSGTLTFFFKSVTYRPTLSKFRGGPVKKTTLYMYVHCLQILKSDQYTHDHRARRDGGLWSSIWEKGEGFSSSMLLFASAPHQAMSLVSVHVCVFVQPWHLSRGCIDWENDIA